MSTSSIPSLARLPWLPTSFAAWVLTLSGYFALLFSLLMQSSMWLTVFRLKPPAAGGGEFISALFVGIPALCCALLLLGFSAFHQRWRSIIGRIGFVLALVPIFAWLALLVQEIR